MSYDGGGTEGTRMARTKEFDQDVALDRTMHLFWR